MTLRLRMLRGLAVILLLSATSVSSALAQGSVTFTGFSIVDVNIRSAPGINSATIGVLPAGERATAVGRNSGNNWIQVQSGATTGWVAAWLTVYSGDTALLPITSVIDPPPTGGPGPFVLTSPYSVNIRSQPHVTAPLVTRLVYGESASAIGRNDLSSWIFVEYQGVQGWVAAWLTLLSGDTNALPVMNAGGSPSPASPSPTPSVPGATPPPPPPEGGLTVLAPFRVNVRSAPSINASVIQVIPYNTVAAAIGQNAGSNWVQVQFDGTQGWVARWVVIGSDDLSSLPVTSDSAEVAPFTGTITGRSIYDLQIRTGPATTYGVVASLPTGATAQIITRTAGNGWFRVSYEGHEGWIAGWLLLASADPNNLPIFEQ